MTKTEFATLAMALKTYYPKDNLLPNQQAMELWYRELQDIPYKVAESALRQHVGISKWPPSIAEIREAVANITAGEIPDWGEGWEQVLRAIRKHGLYNIPDAMNSMDDMTRRCVERLGFREICLSENIAVDRANFRMIYEQLSERKKKEGQTQIGLSRIIAQLRDESRKELQHDESKRISAADEKN